MMKHLLVATLLVSTFAASAVPASAQTVTPLLPAACIATPTAPVNAVLCLAAIAAIDDPVLQRAIYRALSPELQTALADVPGFEELGLAAGEDDEGSAA